MAFSFSLAFARILGGLLFAFPSGVFAQTTPQNLPDPGIALMQQLAGKNDKERRALIRRWIAMDLYPQPLRNDPALWQQFDAWPRLQTALKIFREPYSPAMLDAVERFAGNPSLDARSRFHSAALLYRYNRLSGKAYLQSLLTREAQRQGDFAVEAATLFALNRDPALRPHLDALLKRRSPGALLNALGDWNTPGVREALKKAARSPRTNLSLVMARAKQARYAGNDERQTLLAAVRNGLQTEPSESDGKLMYLAALARLETGTRRAELLQVLLGVAAGRKFPPQSPQAALLRRYRWAEGGDMGNKGLARTALVMTGECAWLPDTISIVRRYVEKREENPSPQNNYAEYVKEVDARAAVVEAVEDYLSLSRSCSECANKKAIFKGLLTRLLPVMKREHGSGGWKIKMAQAAMALDVPPVSIQRVMGADWVARETTKKRLRVLPTSLLIEEDVLLPPDD